MIFRELIFNKATSINIELANKAFNYLLTAIDITGIAITALSTNSFVYNTNAEL